MEFTIVISPEAVTEINEIIAWYNLKKNGLGYTFRNNTKNAINNLKANHLNYQIRYSEFRCCPIKKFPYLIHFKIFEQEKKVVITTIKHTSRNPNIWLDPESK